MSKAPKYKWVARANLVQDCRRTDKNKEHDCEVINLLYIELNVSFSWSSGLCLECCA